MEDHEAVSPVARGIRVALLMSLVGAVLSHAVTQAQWPVDVAVGGFWGIVSGILVAVRASREQRTALAAAAGAMSLGHQREAYRASTSGHIPANPRVRSAAAELVRVRLDRVARQRDRNLRGQAVLAVLSGVLAVLLTPAFLAMTVISLLGLVSTLRLPAMLTARLAALDAGES